MNLPIGLRETASIVTGAGSGSGCACAVLPSQLGSAVCVVDREADAAARTVELIGEMFRGRQDFAPSPSDHR